MKKLSIALALVAVGLAVAYGLPLFFTHSDQDACNFGPVSNAQYRIYRAKADQLTAEALWSRKFGWDDKAFAGQLKRIFDELSKGESSIYARVAIMHSILRSLGAVYDDNIPSATKIDPYVGAPKKSWLATFSYTLDVNKIAMFSPLKRTAWIMGHIAGLEYKQPPGPLYPKRPGELAFVVYLPNLLESPHLPEALGKGCPPVPSSESLKSFSPDSN
jgi:hypothetical protein